MKALPAITDENETVVEFRDNGPDELGRRTWLADDVGPGCNKHGVRG
jgi:hypothetical protein